MIDVAGIHCAGGEAIVKIPRAGQISISGGGVFKGNEGWRIAIGIRRWCKAHFWKGIQNIDQAWNGNIIVTSIFILNGQNRRVHPIFLIAIVGVLLVAGGAITKIPRPLHNLISLGSGKV